MRDPSIHIKLSDLRRVFHKLGIDVSLAEQVVRHSKEYKIIDRQVLLTTKTMKKKVTKLQQHANSNIELFEGELYLERTQQGHKRVRHINPDTSEYNTLIKVSQLATKFANTYDLDITHGIRTYIRIGLQLMRHKYSLNRFVYYDNHIHEEYSKQLELREDSNPKLTEAIYKYYSSLVTVEVDKSADFVYCRIDIEEYNAKPQMWIDAQFEILSFIDVVPTPDQLHGIKAYKRYLRYASERKIQLPKYL